MTRSIDLIVLIFLVLILSIFYGCSTPYSFSSELQSYVKNVNAINGSNNFQIALNSGDITLCYNYSGVLRDQCISSNAIILNDSSKCGEIDNEWYTAKCYRDIAPKKANISLCYMIPKSNDIQHKGEIEKFRNHCIEDITIILGDANKCEEIKEELDRISCYSSFASKSGNTNVCYRIPQNYEDSRDYCIVDAAMILKDQSKCNGVKNIKIKNQCRYDIAIMLNDSSICEGIEDIGKKDTCIYNIAVVIGDKTKCEKITNVDKKADCYFYFDVMSRDISVCYLYTNKKRDSCIFAKVIMLNDTSKCNEIKDEKYKFGCYSQIAFNIGNKEICNLIPENKSREICISNFGLKNKTICNEITDMSIRNACLNR